MKSYRVVYELEEAGPWIATVPAVKGCHTYGRSINEARERVREALGLFVKDAAAARLVDDIRLPANLRRLSKHNGRRASARSGSRLRARAALCRAVSMARGSACATPSELLGLSHQRVQQIREEARA